MIIEFFWSMFSGIRTEYRGLFCKSPYSVQMRENTDKRNSKYGHLFTSSLVLFQCCRIMQLPSYDIILHISWLASIGLEFNNNANHRKYGKCKPIWAQCCFLYKSQTFYFLCNSNEWFLYTMQNCIKSYKFTINPFMHNVEKWLRII